MKPSTPAKKRSTSANDQPSGLGPRLRHLEKDMARLDDERSKLYDDTYSALAHYELKLNETQAILRSRQDSIEKYVEDMRILLETKKMFESQVKSLSERHVSILQTCYTIFDLLR